MFPKNLSYQWLHFRLKNSAAIIGTICSASSLIIALTNNCAKAEIVPDNTLGNESSVVTPGPIDTIEGGAIRGTNLFHSFEKFNIQEGRGAFFSNPNGIENIIGRVTGGSRSEIFGRLGVFGSANLFLVNPNGIIFGPNAQLNIGGSFVGTTANAIKFGDRDFFSASVPDAPPLLTIKPSALQFNQAANQPITIQSTEGLKVLDNQSLLLVGGDVNLEGGKLLVRGGPVELGGLAGAGTVGLNIDGKNLRLSFPDNVTRADVSLTNKATVDVGSEQGSGDVQVRGRRVKIADGSEILANTFSEFGGKLTLNASELVEVTGGSRLLSGTQGSGTAGELTIETGKLIVREGSQIAAGTFNEGLGGNLTIKASDEVELSGTAIIDGKQVSSGLFTQTEGSGDARDLTIKTKRLILQDGAQVSTSTTGSGRAGTLNVIASESIELIGTSVDNSIPSGLFAATQGGSGSSGNLSIETKNLIVRDGAQVLANTVGSGQEGGKLTVKASESVQLIGTNTLSTNGRSGLLVGTTGSGDAGELIIETGKLLVRDGAFISARTLGEGQGGSVIINASDSVELTGTSAANIPEPSSITTETQNGGDAGILTIETGQLSIKNGAEITTSSAGQASAGNIQIQAESINLNQGKIISQTASGDGGNITLSLKDLLVLRDRSQISSTAGTDEAGGDGGNITVNGKDGFIIATPNENSDITANAFEGKGGRIKIDATDIFGMVFRSREDLVQLIGTNDSKQLDPEQLPTNDITAISQQNPDFSGNVEIITPQTDPTSGSIEFPTIPVDTEIADTCSSPGYAQSSFTITGKGSLPPSPLKPLVGRLNQTKLATLDEVDEVKKQQIQTRKKEPIKQIVEAQGWVRTKNGEIILVAYNPQNTNSLTATNSVNCNL